MNTGILQAIADNEPPRLKFGITVTRAFALFIGLFSLINLLAGFRNRWLDASLWWIDAGNMPHAAVTVFLMTATGCLLAFAAYPPQRPGQRFITAVSSAILASLALWNSMTYYRLLFFGMITTSVPVPLSLFLAAELLMIVWFCIRPARITSQSRKTGLVLAGFAGCVVLFPLAQMLFFGHTDYRRPADVAVVLGARAYADGHPSTALEDRVTTACELYFHGQVGKLIFSGGPGDGSVHETESMCRLAIKLGVRPADILLDTGGINTQATVRDTLPMLKELGAKKVLVVSHFYHLPRVKLAYQRAGWDVYTVPAHQQYFLRQTPFYMAREVAALWVYYLRPIITVTGTGNAA